MSHIMRDYACPAGKLKSPSRWLLWLEERILEHNIKVLRNDLDVAEKATDALDASLPKKRDDLHKLLDHQRMRGFPHREELHWPLVLVNWQIFLGVLICAGFAGWQARGAQARWLSRDADGLEGGFAQGQHGAHDPGVQGRQGSGE